MESNVQELLKQYRGKTVAVTGASGLIGPFLVRLLLSSGAAVCVIGRRGASARWEDHDEAIDVIEADLRHPEEVRTALAGAQPDAVLHLGAYGVQVEDREPHTAVAVNVQGSLAVVEGAAQARADLVVHVGTSHEYGSSKRPLVEEAPLNPRGIYGATKAAGMIVSRTHALELGQQWVGVRPFTCFGPGENRTKFIPQILGRALAGEPAPTTDGQQIRDFVYVEDVAEAIALAAVASLPQGQILNLGSGEATRLRDVIELVADIVPQADFRIGALPRRTDDVRCQVADTTRQRELLPAWRPRTELAQGLRHVIDWLQGQA